MREGKVGAVIPGAGRSRRLGGRDKLFYPILGRPLLAWTLEVLNSSPAVDEIVLVLNEENSGRGEELVARYGFRKVTRICLGGERRRDSVGAGLRLLPPCRWVIIHDAARPCLTPALIEQGLQTARACGAAVAAVPAVDTIKLVSGDGLVEATPERHRLWQVQTPQIFDYQLILRAYREVGDDATDDASLVERLGHPVKVFPGSYENIKVTGEVDLLLAETILRRRNEGRPGL